MTIIVPDNMSSFVAGLTAAQLGTIEHQLSGFLVDLTLPKFSAESRFDLADVLEAMGMPTAFEVPTPSAGADLSGITLGEQLYIQHVIHEANIDVDENGVVASAVTVVIGGAGAAGPPPKVTFHINTPFLYFIQERSTGAILFMGRIDDPSAAS
jgi:serpin B